MTTDLKERIAPPGRIWVCCACGKTAKDKYGIEGKRSTGWDESCMLNAQLFDEDKLVYECGRVKEVKP